jgi:hypothetical protein
VRKFTKTSKTHWYTHLAEKLFQGQNEYAPKAAKTEREARALVATGFEYVRGFEGNKIFRKRKC